MTFGAPVANRLAAERAIDIKSTPAMTGKFEWVDSNVVQWVPDDFWPAHSTVALSVGGRPMNFATGAKVVGVASIADHTFSVTIDGAEAGPPSALPARTTGPAGANLGCSRHRWEGRLTRRPLASTPCWPKEDSVVMDSSSVGIPVDSPDGYHLTVDHAVRFTSRGLFVHAAPWAVNSLGHDNVSHGCISLSPEDAEWYFNTVNVGDPIVVRDNNLEVPRRSNPNVRTELAN